MDRVDIPVEMTGPFPPEQEGEATNQESQSRPEWLPEKFKTPEDLYKAYKELEKKQGQPKDAGTENPERTGVAPSSDNPDSDTNEQQAVEALESVGLDFNEFSQEFSEKGELSEESYQKLAGKGIPKEFVDAYIEGQKALASRSTELIFEEVGGQESYQQMVQWAAQNLSPSEIQAYDNAVESSNIDQVKLAVLGLYQRYSQSHGVDPKLLGGSQSDTTADVFQSHEEAMRAQRDPRYKEDPAYREQVTKKILRSKIY